MQSADAGEKLGRIRLDPPNCRQRREVWMRRETRAKKSEVKRTLKIEIRSLGNNLGRKKVKWARRAATPYRVVASMVARWLMRRWRKAGKSRDAVRSGSTRAGPCSRRRS